MRLNKNYKQIQSDFQTFLKKKKVKKHYSETKIIHAVANAEEMERYNQRKLRELDVENCTNMYVCPSPSSMTFKPKKSLWQTIKHNLKELLV